MTVTTDLSSQFPSIQYDPLTCLFHPKSEAEIVQLVQYAYAHNHQVRVIGAGHSVQKTILSTAQWAINMSLDQYRKVTINDDKTVTVQAGCYLGQQAPLPWEDTLFYQLEKNGLAAPDMGGITHQAVGGFTTMGCAGGSLKYAYTDSIVAISLVDGQGNVHSYQQGKDPEFEAVLVSMGLMGIVSTLTFKTGERFNIIGDETCYALNDPNCPIDFFGPGSPGKPSLEQFLRQTEYTRLLWWPQKGAERMVVWQARRMQDSDYNGMTGTPQDFKPKAYAEFPVILGTQIPAQVAASLFYQLSAGWPTLIENWIPAGILRDLVETIIEDIYESEILPFVINVFAPVYNRDAVTSEPYPPVSCPFGNLFSDAIRVVELGRNTGRQPMQGAASQGSSGRRAAGGPVLGLLPAEAETQTDSTRVTSVPIDLWNDVLARMPGAHPHLSKLESVLSERGLKLPRYYHIHVPTEALKGLQTDTTQDSKDPTGTQNFWDNWYGSLPMDNYVSDFLMPTEFTELWIPLEKTKDVMNDLRNFYETGGFKATGSYSCEIYAAKSNKLWLSPAYAQDVIRVDVFWFHDVFRSEDELKAFYQQYWELLRKYDFRPHWAKYIPEGDMGPGYLAQRYPMWKQFLDLRAKMDPKQLFVTDYWRNALGIPQVNS